MSDDREFWKALLPVIQAFIDGKPIQVTFADSPEWRVFLGEHPQFGNRDWKWRVKREEREWWDIQEKSTETVFRRCKSENEAQNALMSWEAAPHMEIIHVREVIH